MSKIGGEVDENLIRHFVLNSLRSYNVKFRDEFGEMIIACDDTNNWRKQFFPYYKANRKRDREASALNWNAIFSALNNVREEIKNFFPYRVIQISTAEADDVIGVLCNEFGNTSEKILIVSGDKDYRQLQSFMNVRQYDPVQKKWVVENNPELYLKQHILKGDKGDGIPNFLSPDDTFVMKIRQKPISEKKLDEWVKQDPRSFCDSTMLSRYNRNEMMIDMSKIPENIKTAVMESYHAQANKTREHLFNYFIQHRLKNLMSDLNQF
jgi:5'-3' exonuclease